ncbi:hypothetical protein CCP3SC1AL1_1720008 [Gammaproteobacteria bacterium]
MEVTIPYADLKAVIGLIIVGVSGMLLLYKWLKNRSVEG